MSTPQHLKDLEPSERPRPSVSVVIPTFNRADVLGRCLHSVLRQTLPPDEVIVVDDASEDDTAAVVGAYGEAVRYVRQPVRSGAQAARNRGIREAREDWIAFQDADDEWFPDKLERQIALLAERDSDPWTVVHGQGIVRESDSDPWWFPERTLKDGDVLDELLGRPATLFPTLVVSRVALDRIGALDENAPSYHEWDTSIRLAHVCRFVGTKQPVFIYQRGEADAISNSTIRDIQGYQYVIDKHRGEIVERCGDGAWEDHLLHQLRRSLDFGLWEEADRLLERVQLRGPRYQTYALCRRLRIRPSYVARARRLLERRKSRRQAAAAT